MREDIDSYTKHILYQHSSRLAEKSGIIISMPRVSQHQQNHSNPQFSTVEDYYYKKTIAIPFLDHIISDISSRFTTHTKQAASLQALLPSSITPTSSIHDEIQEAITFYSDDLPNPAIR